MTPGSHRAGHADSDEGGSVKLKPAAVLTASVYSVIWEHGEGSDELGK